ncbi:hypothetical protein H8356DRAFT_1649332 [Neocallimastix lanati (nom. inval.)]|uniref:DUF866-domain-containing protein n=1 Tax=Neocallimastix californiae TaxID=1754190 RepID=A0A1Y2CJB4_9FUNG|nr:hypothetical protein H8356DRAFT_1649332 [Neocallimastix sp. JGI-2020a]ORY47140.1 DUF866-domain-containing protein [Neocallimastix californiae]|eukprot:ORY47140.1 DUF866-domain-containing protein [Neocallimastix californiae]
MGRFQIQWKMYMENVSKIKPVGNEWEIKFRCEKCDELGSTFSVVDADEEMEIPGSRGVCNLVIKCKCCKNNGNINIEKSSIQAYDDENENFKPLVNMECRGLIPEEWNISGLFEGEGSSENKIEEIELDEKEWSGYDEDNDAALLISDVEYQINKIK